jgi:hypothetical protein
VDAGPAGPAPNTLGIDIVVGHKSALDEQGTFTTVIIENTGRGSHLASGDGPPDAARAADAEPRR